MPSLKPVLGLLAAVALAGAVGSASRQSPATPPFFFVQMSDPQFGMFTKDAEFSQETLNFELAIATMNRWRPAFVIVTGDLVNKPGDPAQIAEYHRIAARLDPSIPIYHVAGNHDVENEPTPAALSAYTAKFGRDYYSFRSRNLAGIVLNSSLIHSPNGAPEQAEAQLAWLRRQLSLRKASSARHLVVFQHHPWFLERANEADQYFNIPRARRDLYLALFRASGVRYLFSGHYHRNAVAEDAGFSMITTGPVGMPLGEGTQSGVRVVIVRDEGLSHRYYGFGELPHRIEVDLTISGRPSELLTLQRKTPAAPSIPMKLR